MNLNYEVNLTKFQLHRLNILNSATCHASTRTNFFFILNLVKIGFNLTYAHMYVACNSQCWICNFCHMVFLSTWIQFSTKYTDFVIQFFPQNIKVLI